MVGFTGGKSGSTESKKVNRNINVNMARMTDAAKTALLLYPEFSIPVLFPNKDVRQENALAAICDLERKLNGNDEEVLTEKEDALLGCMIDYFRGPVFTEPCTQAG